jgi:hypothetical protein
VLDARDQARGASEVIALAGALGGLAEAATKTLPNLSSLRLSKSTVEWTTERVGPAVTATTLAGGVQSLPDVDDDRPGERPQERGDLQQEVIHSLQRPIEEPRGDQLANPVEQPVWVGLQVAEQLGTGLDFAEP